MEAIAIGLEAIASKFEMREWAGATRSASELEKLLAEKQSGALKEGQSYAGDEAKAIVLGHTSLSVWLRLGQPK